MTVNTCANQERVNQLVTLKETSGYIDEDDFRNHSNQCFKTCWKVFRFLCGVDGFVEQYFDILERVLVHIIDASHVSNHEVNDATSDGDALIAQTSLVDFFFNNCRLSDSQIDFS